MKELIGGFGAAVYAVVFLGYAVVLWLNKGKGMNPASILMWTILDSIFLAVSVDAEESLYLPLAYVTGTGACLFVLLFKGTWKWSLRELFAFIGAAISVYVWQTVGSDWGFLACMLALLFAGAPMFRDLVKEPVRSTWPMWVATAFACVCTLLASDWSFASTVVAWGGVVYNIPLTIIVLRGK